MENIRISTIISAANIRFPCPDIDKMQQIKWLQLLDEQIVEDIISKYEDNSFLADKKDKVKYTSDADVVLAPSRFIEMYIYWLMAQMEYYKQETRRYSNDLAQFQKTYDDFSRWYKRNNMPLQKNRLKLM